MPARKTPVAELASTSEYSAGVHQQVYPPFGAILTGFRAPADGSPRPRISFGTFNPAFLVQAEQSVGLFRPLPPWCMIEVISELVGIYDKGSGALVVTESRTVPRRHRGLPDRPDPVGGLHPWRGWVRRQGPQRALAGARTRPRPVGRRLDPGRPGLPVPPLGGPQPVHSDPTFVAKADFLGSPPSAAGSASPSSPATASRSRSGGMATKPASVSRDATAAWCWIGACSSPATERGRRPRRWTAHRKYDAVAVADSDSSRPPPRLPASSGKKRPTRS
ncbi:hypothetical protein [Streptomyces carpinensis]|uniref:hypothetical protein n=1 Tax=Streptomyces carpinensis TaxID=66369 RepID=UPI003CC63BE7